MVMPKDPEKAEATRKRMSESAKKRVRTAEEEEARLQAARSTEAIAKLSATQKARLANPEIRKAMSEATKKTLANPEVRQQRNEATKAGLNRPEVKIRRSEQMKKVWEETDIRERVSEAVKKAMVEVVARPEYKQNLENAMKITRATPEYQEAHAKGLSKMHRYRERTSIEVIVASLLTSLGVEYEEQKRIGRYSVDFYIPGKNLVIECDGSYWHSERKPGAKEKDARKDAYLTSCGYSILRLPEVEIKNGDSLSLLSTLL